MLNVTERQLRSWERQKLIPPSQTFGFADLTALRAIAALRKKGASAASISKAVSSVRTLFSDVTEPLREVKLSIDGKTIRVQVAGMKMDSLSGQLLLDFDVTEMQKLLALPPQQSKDDSGKSKINRRMESERWFHKGLELEQRGAPVQEIVAAYRKASELDPESAGAFVNLGTLYFNQRAFAEAEKQYRLALNVDPDYALAHFNLGNLFDERGDRAKALMHYQSAIRLQPRYADAHYNLALLYQSSGQYMKALRHWTLYLRLDPASEWAAIARREQQKLRKATIVKG